MSTQAEGNQAVVALTMEEEGDGAFARFRLNGGPRWPEAAQLQPGRSKGCDDELI
jgi:hypothetical protein